MIKVWINSKNKEKPLCPPYPLSALTITSPQIDVSLLFEHHYTHWGGFPFPSVSLMSIMSRGERLEPDEDLEFSRLKTWLFFISYLSFIPTLRLNWAYFTFLYLFGFRSTVTADQQMRTWYPLIKDQPLHVLAYSFYSYDRNIMFYPPLI